MSYFKGYFIFIIILLFIFPHNIISNPNPILEYNYIKKPSPTINISSTDNLINFSNQTQNSTISIIDKEYPHVAFVQPSFTAAAYDGFYDYYPCFRVGNCETIDARPKLIQQAVDSWSTSIGADRFIDNIKSEGYPAEMISIIDDRDIHFGNIFNMDGSPKYSTLIFFHNEYVTMDEYHNVINFIKVGGSIIILNGNAFFAEVDYNEVTNDVILVSGHGVEFDGENATELKNYHRFFESLENSENVKWLGSEYSSFKRGAMPGANFEYDTNNPHPIAKEMNRLGYNNMATFYISHEENGMISRNAHIIADWETTFTEYDRGIKIYEFFPDGPVGGSLIHFGFFGTDILNSDYASRLAFIVAVKHQAGYYNDPWIRYPSEDSVLSDGIVLDFTDGWNTIISINNQIFENLNRYSSLDFLEEGKYNLSIEFRRDNTKFVRTVSFQIDRTSPTILFSFPNDSLIYQNQSSKFTITVEDVNPEYYFVSASQGIDSEAILYKENIADKQKFNLYNFTKLYSTNLSEGTWVFQVDAVDSAGNSNRTYYTLSINSKSTSIIRVQPNLIKVNESYAKVSLPAFPSNYSVSLQYTEDTGQSWYSNNFQQSEFDPEIIEATIKRNHSRIWYRVMVKNNQSSLYLPTVKTFQWDLGVIGIKSHNLTRHETVPIAYTIEIMKNKYLTTNMTIRITNDESIMVYDSQLISNGTDMLTRLNISLPSLTSGIFNLEVEVKTLTSTYSYRFTIYYNFSYTNSIVLTESQYEINLQGSSNVSDFHIETLFQGSTIILKSINSTIISGYRLSQEPSIHILTWTSGKFLVEVLEYNLYGNLVAIHALTFKVIYQIFISNTGLDGFYQNTPHDQLLSWIINGGNGGSYIIYANDATINQGIWEPDKPITINLDHLLVGNYQLTIVVFDENGVEYADSIVIRVYQAIKTSTIGIEQHPTTSTSAEDITSSNIPPIDTTSKSKNSDSPILTFYFIMALFLINKFRSKLKD